MPGTGPDGSALPDLDIRPLASSAEYRACVELQDVTWGAGFGESVPPTILRLTQELGGIASGAFDPSGRLLGFVFGLTGWVEGRPVHWSDMLAVHPDARDLGIGERLKRHQRELLLARGVRLARWTFDPLEARNARLNLSRLGATSGEYRRDYYGEGVSTLHEGIGTDRLVMDWRLDSTRVIRRLAGDDPPPALADLNRLPVINPVLRTAAGVVCDDAQADLVAPRLLLAVPASIQQLKRDDPGCARRWRRITRTAFETYLGRGYRVTEFVRGDGCGFYLFDGGG